MNNDPRFYDMMSITDILRGFGATATNDPITTESIARAVMDKLVQRGWKPPPPPKTAWWKAKEASRTSDLSKLRKTPNQGIDG